MKELGRGSELAGYRIESVLGRGGMGVVYLATQERLGRSVALKVIAPRLSDDPIFRRRFQRESRLAASIEHPHAVPVYEAGEADGTVYIAMRYVEGTDLRAVLAGEQWLAPARAARLVAQVGGALDEAHSRGLVHRDVKPANVLIGEVGGEEWAYLTDFGVTKPASGTEITGSGEWMGTLDYASPEQIQGEAVDARSDVYALGCVLFESLTGRIPFERENQVAKLYAHVNDPPRAPSELDPAIPAGLDAVVARALAKEPGDRYPSAGDLGRAAEAAAAGEAASPREHSVATGEARVGVGAREAPTRVLSRLRPRVPGSRPPWLLVGVLGGTAVVIAALLLLLGGGGSDPEVVAEIRTGGSPLSVAVGEDAVWVSDRRSDSVSRIDPADNRVSGQPIPVGSEPIGVKTGEGAVWVANSADDTVSRIDPDSRKVVSVIPVGHRPAGVRVGDGAVWVSDVDADEVSRIDPGSERVQQIKVGDSPAGIADGEGGIWVANSGDGTVSRIAPDAAEVVGVIKVGTRPRGIAVGGGSVWVSNSLDGTVTRIDPDTSRTVGDPIRVGNGPATLAAGDQYVWVANERDDTVSRIDMDSGEVVGEPLEVGARPRGVATGEDSIWVTNSRSGSVSRINP